MDGWVGTGGGHEVKRGFRDVGEERRRNEETLRIKWKQGVNARGGGACGGRSSH